MHVLLIYSNFKMMLFIILEMRYTFRVNTD